MHAARSPAATVALALLALWWAVTLGWWALAFAPMDTAPVWLARTQAICFGTSEDGLPEPFGWVALVVGPGGMLAGLLVTFRDDLAFAAARLRLSVVGTLVIVAFVATTTAEAALITRRISDGLALRTATAALPTLADAMPDGWPRDGRAAPELALVDHAGARVDLASLRGKVVVLTFAFAHCQTICPTLVKRVQGAAGELPADVELLIVTLDPWRDTPSALPAIAQGWRLGARQRVLSGAVDEVNRVLDAYGVPRGRDEKTGDVAHPALVVVIDPTGRIAYVLNGPSTDWIADAVDRARSVPRALVGAHD